MTTSTHRRTRRPRRNSMLEALGFIETPSVSFTSDAPRPHPVKKTQLVSTSGTKAHTVEELWNTTELETDSLVDWKPAELERRLNKRIRWPFVVIWGVILGVLAYAGYWAWGTQQTGSDLVVVAVQDAARDLGDTLEPMAEAVLALTATGDPIAESILTTSGQTDDASRALFSVAAELPQTQSSTRSIASEAATHALEASKGLTSAAAYVGAVAPVLTPPPLITDPESIDLATAATDFGSWRSRFETMLSSLPDGVMTPVTQNLTAIGNRLEGIQTAYLDGLREDDALAAAAALDDLSAELSAAWDLLEAETEVARQAVVSQIEAAQDALVSLTG